MRLTSDNAGRDNRLTMRTRFRTLGTITAKLAVLSAAGVSLVHADLTFSGTLDPAANSALTYWDQFQNSFTSPIAGPDDFDRAFNIAIHHFTISTAGLVTFSSLGFGMGGFDSVISVFEGTGDSAVYLDHEFAPLGPGDFSFDLNLGVGTYTLAVAMFGSEPCASGLCTGPLAGTLGDGFTNLVNFDPSRPDPLFYSVNVTASAAPVPEPSCALLLAVCVAVILARKHPGSRKRTI